MPHTHCDIHTIYSTTATATAAHTPRHHLHRADAAAKGDERAAKLPAVVAAADDVIAAINTTQLAAFLALRAPADTADGGGSSSNGSNGGSNGSGSSAAVEAYKEEKAERDKEKSALLAALRCKLKAQLDLAEV